MTTNTNKALELFELYKDKGETSSIHDGWERVVAFDPPKELKDVWESKGVSLQYINKELSDLYDKSVKEEKPSLLDGICDTLYFYFIVPNIFSGNFSLYGLLNTIASPFEDYIKRVFKYYEIEEILNAEKILYDTCFYVYAFIQKIKYSKLYSEFYIYDAHGNFHFLEIEKTENIDLKSKLQDFYSLKETFTKNIKKEEDKNALYEKIREKQAEEKRIYEEKEKKRQERKLSEQLENEKVKRAQNKEIKNKIKNKTLQLQSLYNKIEAFNNSIKDVEFNDYYSLVASEIATDKEIAELESIAKVSFPTDLVEFYKTIGSIKNEADECYAVRLEPVSVFIEKIETIKYFSGTPCAHLRSLGLIEFIADTWAYDFIDYFSKEDVDFFNENYTCFGFVRFGSGVGRTNYLYFDKQNNFGYVHYNQECFYDLWSDHLTEMKIKSPAKYSFEELVIAALNDVEVALLESK